MCKDQAAAASRPLLRHLVSFAWSLSVSLWFFFSRLLRSFLAPVLRPLRRFAPPPSVSGGTSPRAPLRLRAPGCGRGGPAGSRSGTSPRAPAGRPQPSAGSWCPCTLRARVPALALRSAPPALGRFAAIAEPEAAALTRRCSGAWCGAYSSLCLCGSSSRGSWCTACPRCCGRCGASRLRRPARRGPDGLRPPSAGGLRHGYAGRSARPAPRYGLRPPSAGGLRHGFARPRRARSATALRPAGRRAGYAPALPPRRPRRASLRSAAARHPSALRISGRLKRPSACGRAPRTAHRLGAP